MKGKLILITGASSGIGAEIAKGFSRLGAKVLLLARNEEKLNKIEEEINALGGQANAFSLDVGNYKDVVKVANQIKEEIGIPDIIINNAGGGK